MLSINTFNFLIYNEHEAIDKMAAQNKPPFNVPKIPFNARH